MNNRGLNYNVDSSFSDLNDDVDDMAFLSHPKQGSSGYLLGGNDGGRDSRENRQRQLLEERRKIEERTLQSSKVSLGLLYDSEQTAIGTAEELSSQREKLSATEERLDTINSTMRVSQKHLTSMKSIFGGFMSYFKPTDPQVAVSPRSTPMANTSGLKNTLEKVKEECTASSVNNHPSFRNRGIGVMDECDEDAPRSQGKGSAPNAYKQRSGQIEKQLDNNLTELDHGLGRLKTLALGLGSEIEDQNHMLDRITTKTERAEDTISFQNRQMKKLLK